MESVNTFWYKNARLKDVDEFHFASSGMSFVAYFVNGELAFVIDGTRDVVCPNDILLVKPLPDEKNPGDPKVKWDRILKDKFGVPPLSIRPKENTKYRKLDIAYTGLDLYDSFISLPSEELFVALSDERESLALETAYQREAEDLLDYNKSGVTLEKAELTLNTLKKRILNISKRLKRQEEIEEKKPEKADESLKRELVQKLYTATDKLRRTERRIKRARKRFDDAFKDLSAKRAQIAEIKRRMDERERENAARDVENTRENRKYLPLDALGNISDNQEVDVALGSESESGKIEHLTTVSNGAMNPDEEKQEKRKTTWESAMAKDNSKDTSQEFKPPFVDDTAQSQGSDIRFARKSGVALDDRFKKILMYSASVIISLLLVFFIFYLVNGSDADNEAAYTRSYVEQAYLPEPEPVPMDAPVYEESEIVVNDAYYGGYNPEPVVLAPIVEPAPLPEPKPVYTKPKIEKKAVVKKVAPVKPVAKPAAKPAPVRESVVAKPAEESPMLETVEVAKYEVDEDVEYDEDSDITLDDYRDDYVSHVISGDAYISLIDAVKYDFYKDTDGAAVERLEKMNYYWNMFRNATYDEYYENDYALKPGIDYDAFVEDERLLRLYSNAYFDLYERLANEFVMVYEYANGTASELYYDIEQELQTLGRPNAKLRVLAQIHDAVQEEGGSVAVIEAIALREIASADESTADEEDLILIGMSDAEDEDDSLSDDESMYGIADASDDDAVDADEEESDYADAADDENPEDSDDMDDSVDVTVIYEEFTVPSDADADAAEDVEIAPAASSYEDEGLVIKDVPEIDIDDEGYYDDAEYAGDDDYYEDAEDLELSSN
jgi:hypothetical protein